MVSGIKMEVARTIGALDGVGHMMHLTSLGHTLRGRYLATCLDQKNVPLVDRFVRPFARPGKQPIGEVKILQHSTGSLVSTEKRQRLDEIARRELERRFGKVALAAFPCATRSQH